MCVCVCVNTATANTFDELQRHFATSLLALWFGRHPPVDSAGLPWPPNSLGESLAGEQIFRDNRFGVVWDVLGDVERHAVVLKLPHWQTDSPCWLCRANTTDRNGADWRPEAPWRGTVIMSATARAAPARGHPLLPILKMTGINDLFVKPGNMHILEGGMMLYFHGGALLTLVQASTSSIPGAPPKPPD